MRINDPNWTITRNWQSTSAGKAFANLDKVFHLKGTVITKDNFSEVILVKINNNIFYIKRYISSGKGLRKYIGQSKIRSEWENMFFFHNIGIPAANIVSYGEERKYGIFQRGALITEGVTGTTDLAKLAKQKDTLLTTLSWIIPVIKQVAIITRNLHNNSFIHTDLKWRNILVTTSEPPRITLIDCPSGYICPQNWLFKNFFQRGIIKDLACLDKIAKHTLSRSQRLYFYKQYTGISKLLPKHKQQIKNILMFFEGRE